MKVRIAKLEDIGNLVDHDLRHMKEEGYKNLPFHPFPKNYVWEREKMIDRNQKGWSAELTSTGWRRTFILLNDEEKIIGHLSLTNQLLSSLHRASVGMGIESSARGQGAGKLLMKAAIDWARSQDSLYWIDLNVFTHNIPAIKLYQSFGFKTLSTVEDIFRVDGVSIDDIHMVLKLR